LINKILNDEDNKQISRKRKIVSSLQGKSRFQSQPYIRHIVLLLFGGNINKFFKISFSSSLQSHTRLNKKSFVYIFDHFQLYWNISCGGIEHSYLAKKKLTCKGTFGLILWHLAFRNFYQSYCTFIKLTKVLISNYLCWGMRILLKTLKNLFKCNMDYNEEF
jgi:predicted membrane channel-forming protein YqfA (hemolysin III family)